MEGEGAHLGSSLPMSVHVHARLSSFVCVHLRSCVFHSFSFASSRFRSWAVAFIHGHSHSFVGGRVCSWVVAFVHGQLHLCSFMGGHAVGEVWWWWAVGGWW